jgi:ribonuclease P protein component
VPTKLTTALNKENYTFSRQSRLLNGRDFQSVFRANTGRSSDQLWTVLARKNEVDHARLGLAISKRVVKTAVERNRLKRIVRESFRYHQQLLAGLDVVVMCRDGVRQSTNRKLFDSLKVHWKRVADRA